MSTVSRGVVYSLIAVVIVLLLGIAVLLSVASHRHQRLQDTTIDLQRNISQQEGKIRELQKRLENCDTTQIAPQADSGWSTAETITSESDASHLSRSPLR